MLQTCIGLNCSQIKCLQAAFSLRLCEKRPHAKVFKHLWYLTTKFYLVNTRMLV